MENNHKSKGPTIGIVVIILIIIIGGVYIFSVRESNNNNWPADDQTQELLNQSEATDLETIEQDAINTNLENLSEELGVIEQELEAQSGNLE